MKIWAQKELLHYGEYQVGRIIMVTTLKGETTLKFNVLNKSGDILYKFRQNMAADNFEVIAEALSSNDIEDIQQIFSNNETEWGECSLEDTLGIFGLELVDNSEMLKYGKSDNDTVISYSFYSSTEQTGAVSNKLEFFEEGTSEQEIIGTYLVPKLLAKEDSDIIKLKIIENGELKCYRITLEAA